MRSLKQDILTTIFKFVLEIQFQLMDKHVNNVF